MKVSQKEYIKSLKPDLLTIFGALASFYCYNAVFNNLPNLLQSQKILPVVPKVLPAALKATFPH